MFEMRNLLNRSIGLAMLVLVGVGCQPDVTVPVAPEFRSTQFDESAAQWNPILAADTNFYAAVPRPQDHTAGELQEMLASFRAMDDRQRSDVRFWNAGSVLQWNAIACDLVAKYNVAPFPERLADMTFTGRFISDPQRPFANPPFAARLYALLSAAHYDAMIHCWRLKQGRSDRSPADLSTEFGNAAPATSWSSWPSEDAAIATISRVILSALFPLESSSLTDQAKRAVQSRLLAGRIWKSDAEAGDSIGMAIARKYMEYAATDGMANANNQAQWNAINAKITVPYPKWRSVEIPARPPMLPLFGNVKMWFVPSLEAVDPGPPPAEGTPQWNADMEEMRFFAASRSREQARIGNFWEDGAGTYTPPGHWCKIARDEIYARPMSLIRAAKIMAYVGTALHDAAVIGWAVKYKYVHPRPHAIDPKITMSLGLPNFPGYISGHSTFSAAGATVLAYFIPERAQVFHDMAIQASESRIYSRIHMRVDCEVGNQVGKEIGAYSVNRARQDVAQ